ncbi:hypothetical protein M514_12201 [Trichuris suis]|uniref:Uncharacterized protein n=1 Tax=Trichuris suis TaxID=68888 RepID=A0A085N460_9BILA|nr:hypothetical protein M513_12201 [Trichuris suis]KFD64256.1 hypothetical protein M514_12201 [Trichuris suis]
MSDMSGQRPDQCGCKVMDLFPVRDDLPGKRTGQRQMTVELAFAWSHASAADRRPPDQDAPLTRQMARL